MRKNVLWITRTSLLIALTVVLQGTTAMLGNTLITGSVVNFMLIVSVMICGLASGLAVGAVTPIMAFMFSIGATIPIIIPFVCVANMTLVLIWHFIGNKKNVNEYISRIIALITAAAVKFTILFFGVTKIAVLIVPTLPPPVLAAFSFPQLITASIGGTLAIITLPILKKAIRNK